MPMTSKNIHETLGWCIWLESSNLAYAFKGPLASRDLSEEGKGTVRRGEEKIGE